MLTVKLWKLWKNGTFNGILISGIVLCFFQDYLGRDKYLDFCRQHWFSFPWWFWFCPLTVLAINNLLHWKTLYQQEKIHVWANEVLNTMATVGRGIKDQPQVIYPPNNTN